MPDPTTPIFALAALALLVASGYLTWRALQHRDLLRESAAVIALGLAGAMAYETAALATGSRPTISGIVADEFARHPVQWLAFSLPVPLLVGGLVVHFTLRRRQASWFVFAGGLVTYLLGGLFVYAFHLLP